MDFGTISLYANWKGPRSARGPAVGSPLARFGPVIRTPKKSLRVLRGSQGKQRFRGKGPSLLREHLD